MKKCGRWYRWNYYHELCYSKQCSYQSFSNANRAIGSIGSDSVFLNNFIQSDMTPIGSSSSYGEILKSLTELKIFEWFRLEIWR
ncbi:MAG: hypothetical protein LBD84_01130 [Campylobacteraceae bacterium]|nr:hypothetical protein [Campylobacteraceae bacterium]